MIKPHIAWEVGPEIMEIFTERERHRGNPEESAGTLLQALEMAFIRLFLISHCKQVVAGFCVSREAKKRNGNICVSVFRVEFYHSAKGNFVSSFNWRELTVSPRTFPTHNYVLIGAICKKKSYSGSVC